MQTPALQHPFWQVLKLQFEPPPPPAPLHCPLMQLPLPQFEHCRPDLPQYCALTAALGTHTVPLQHPLQLAGEHDELPPPPPPPNPPPPPGPPPPPWPPAGAPG